MKLHVTANPSNCWFNLYRAGAKHSKRIALQEPIIETGHVFWTHIYALNCVINHRMQTFETKIIFRWFIQLQRKNFQFFRVKVKRITGSYFLVTLASWYFWRIQSFSHSMLSVKQYLYFIYEFLLISKEKTQMYNTFCFV